MVGDEPVRARVASLQCLFRQLARGEVGEQCVECGTGRRQSLFELLDKVHKGALVLVRHDSGAAQPVRPLLEQVRVRSQPPSPARTDWAAMSKRR